MTTDGFCTPAYLRQQPNTVEVRMIRRNPGKPDSSEFFDSNLGLLWKVKIRLSSSRKEKDPISPAARIGAPIHIQIVIG